MNKKIISDSASNMRTLDGVDFTSVPLTIITNEKEYVDDAGLDVDKMVEELYSYKGRSSTACPGVGDWLKSFGDAEEVYCVTIISTLSGSYNSAMTAKQQYEEEYPQRKVFVLDSYSAGPEMKLLVEKLKELVLSGKDYDTICREITEHKEKHTSLAFGLESLKNLANNGRVSHAVAAITNIMGIRLVGNVSPEGQLHPVYKSRGEKKAIASILSCMKEQRYAGGTVVIDHCCNENGANSLKEAIRKEYPDANVRIEKTTGLCSFYAEKGGLMIGFEV
ncbi:MAG: DegV family protein [Thermoflexaceae bacterium]|nr:DegV family protein [Thermoflexaceae bacterium]